MGNLISLKRGLTKEEYKFRILNILAMDVREIQDYLRDPDQCALDRWIASITLRGIKEGDPKRLDYFMNRIIGPIETNVKIQGQINHQSLQEYIEEKGEVIRINPKKDESKDNEKPL